MKKYENPMLQVVSIKRNDIVTASESMTMFGDYNSSTMTIGAAGRRIDEWYEGY